MSQLNLFVAQVSAPAPTKAAAKIPVSKPAYCIEPSNNDYLSVYLMDVWIGSIRALTRSLFALYFPGERGICGFGGPTQRGAAAELHRCYPRDGKELPRG